MNNRINTLVRRMCGATAVATLSIGLSAGELSAAEPSADESAESSRVKLEEILEEIVVTAQKREQRLQDVPMSISVLTGDNLDRSSAEGLTEVLSRVPGVATQVNPQGGGTQLTVRGVAAAGALQAGSSPIAYYLDAVPFGTVLNAVVPDVNPYDLERVEVLRGPQGTLYGASALNGVVRILTKDADPRAFDLKARTSLSTTEGGGENYRADMAVNVPIVSEKLAARAVIGYQDSDGWIDRPNLDKPDANDSEILNARLKVNAQPTDQLSIGLSAGFSRSDYGAPPQSLDGKQNLLLDEPMSTDYDVYGLSIDYDFPIFSVASKTGYIEYANDGFLDLSAFFGNSLRTQWDARVFSQEVLLASLQDGSWRWSVGGMYRDGEERVRQSFSLAPSGSNQDRSNTSESFAAFGELTRVFLSGKVELTGGLRYFEDDVGQLAVFGPGVPPGEVVRNKSKFDKVSPRVVLTWLPTDQKTVYASYSEGFRSGSDQSPTVLLVVPDFAAVKPDNLTNYELGAKSTLWNGRLSIDTSIYYMDWQDVQQVLAVTVGDSSFVSARINGVSASGVGVDFGVTARPNDKLELGATVSWNDLSMDSDVFSATAAGPVLLFASGDRLNASPEYTIGASADYFFDLGSSGLDGTLSASANYVSKQETRTINSGVQALGAGDSILMARTSFSISTPTRWRATLYVDNVTNENGVVQRGPLAVGPFSEWAQRARPRTFGAQIDYRF